MPKDIRQTPEYAKYLSSIGWEVTKIDNNYIFIKHLPILGNIIKIQRPEDISEEEIKRLSRKYRPFQIIVEPKNNLQLSIYNLQFKQTSPYLPSKTLVLDLTKSEKHISSHFKKDARYAIRKNLKLKITNLKLKDLEEFRKDWKKSVPIKRYILPLSHLTALKKAFEDKALFLETADKNSGAIFLIGDEVAYYWQAFTNSEGRKKLYQYQVVWNGILWAKKMHCKYLDFEGIYDERHPNKSWLGFTHFKKSFAGVETLYPGAFIKTLPHLRVK